MRREVLAGVGTASGADLVLDLGAAHPSSHGGLRLALVLDDGPDGEVVVSAEPGVGLLHRGAEKLFEVRDYRQALVLANRHDWLASFSNEIGIALAVERLLGLEVPPRAVWLRVLLAELTRVLSSLSFLGGSVPLTLGGERERVQELLEEATGGRLHLMANRVGGLLQDVPAGWPGRAAAVVAHVRARLPEVRDAVEERVAPLAGVGVVDEATALAHGASGPVARASGVDLDVRRDDPYLAYAELEVPVAVRREGDVVARFRCLLDGLEGALDLADACLGRLPAGAVSVRLPSTVRAPEGATYAWTENPTGAMGYYLVSRGATTPWRLAMRTPSFGNVSLLPALLPGVRLADLPLVLMSLFFVIGDLDK